MNVKAEAEKGMKPLSDLAEGLGTDFVFGNAILWKKWLIKQWKSQKIFDDTDFRQVLFLQNSRRTQNRGSLNSLTDELMSRNMLKMTRSFYSTLPHSTSRRYHKTTIDVPKAGELNLHCTHLDHLDDRTGG
ncbi:unnamed protein product [Musa banksii]